MADEKDIALIGEYLEGKLEDEARSALEERLGQDSGFEALFKDIEVLTLGLGKLQNRTLLNRMDELEEGLENPLEKKPEVKTIFWTFQRVAATFVGLAVVALVSWYTLRDTTAPSPQELYVVHYTVYPNSMVPVVRGEEEESLINRTFQAYEQGDYTRAESFFELLMAEDDREFIRLYAAITAMELERNNKAEGLLVEIVAGEGDFVNQARWYLALNFLKKEEIDQSIVHLEALAATQSTYRARAQELLKELK